MTNEGDEVKSQMVQERLATMKERRLQAITAINQSSKGQDVPSSFLVGTQVWLEGTHLRLPYQATKLAPKRYGPFEITREISPVAYQLCLPIAWNIHNVFHTSLLSPYRETDTHRPNYSRPPPDLIEGEEEYEVEKVINHRYTGKTRTLQYLVKWKGYLEADNTWEPADQVHAPQLVKAYHRQSPLEDKRERTSTRSIIRILSSKQQRLPTDLSTKVSSRQCRPDPLPPNSLRGRNGHKLFETPTPSSLTRRYKESWDPIAPSSASWHKLKGAPSPLDQRETSPKEKTCTLWCFTASSTPWPRPPGGRIADTQSKRGSLKKPSTCHAKMAYDVPPSGSNAWTGEESPVIPKTTPQGTSPSSPTYTPQKCTTTTTMRTLLGHYLHGSSPPLGGAGPRMLPSAVSSISSPFTTGASWPRSTATVPWMSSASRSAARSTSSNRSFRRPVSRGGLARVGWKWPRLIDKSAT